MLRKPTVPMHNRRALLAALLLASAALGGCKHDAEVITNSVPDDYRLRHPISITEADRSTEIFVGNSRGGLSAAQRGDVISVANTWLREGTGAIVVDVPVRTPNARAATDNYREIHGLLASAGIPPRGITMRNYTPENPRLFATIRISYPRIAATAGPCGLWPDDLGTSIKNRDNLSNKPYYNLGCSHQRNLAAMIDNPSDLVQPRPETPAYTMRRTATFDKYRKAIPTATIYPDGEKAKLSDLGK